ncbi:hypothetical protein LOZ58_002769 [Ophidiomyces ophidiicola]|nr:hypothetical protein LOZ58_002769 [Ophidiomyces ophidiicola]
MFYAQIHIGNRVSDILKSLKSGKEVKRRVLAGRRKKNNSNSNNNNGKGRKEDDTLNSLKQLRCDSILPDTQTLWRAASRKAPLSRRRGMSNKIRLLISIHHRDEISLQEGIRNTYGAYHWGILLAPKSSSGRDNAAYDVSDGVILNSETGQDLNLAREWHFRKANVNPLESGRLIGRIVIGKVPHRKQKESILSSVTLPDKESNERCRHWVWRAISTLQDALVIPKFDIEEFKA